MHLNSRSLVAAATLISSALAFAVERLDVRQPPTGPTELPSYGEWESQGCYSDKPARTLTYLKGDSPDMTVGKCADLCAAGDFLYAGVEVGHECWCGNVLRNGGGPEESGCSEACGGDPTQLCGGPDRMNLYKFGEPVVPVALATYKTFNSVGCYTDSNSRALHHNAGSSDDMTAEKCLDICLADNYKLAGVEFGRECFCGNSIQNLHSPAADGCSFICEGNYRQLCGGAGRLNVWKNGDGPITAGPPVVVASYGKWSQPQCYTDSRTARTLEKSVHPVANFEEMTVEICLDACAAQNYTLGGLEFGSECWCGNSIQAPGAPASSGCTSACLGNANQICGGDDRLTVYKYVVAPPPPVKYTGKLKVVGDDGKTLGYIGKLVPTFPVDKKSAAGTFTFSWAAGSTTPISIKGSLLGIVPYWVGGATIGSSRSDISATSTNWLTFISVPETKPGAPPDGPLSLEYASAIWFFDPATKKFRPQWVNDNKSTPVTYLRFDSKVGLYFTGKQGYSPSSRTSTGVTLVFEP